MVVVAEVAILVTAVGWFLSPNITTLMELARSFASNKYNLSTGMKEKLQKVAQDLEDIKGLLDPGSMGLVNDQTRLDHVWRLKDAIHDAEEILDLFELEKKGGASTNFSWAGSSSKGTLLDNLVKVLENLRDRARELYQDSRRDGVSTILPRADTGPAPVRNKELFFGYAEEYFQLVSMLQLDCNKMVIAIIGHGGMGKTELARQAYRDVGGKFDLSIWAHAYDKKTEFDLLKEIWKSVEGHRPVGEMNLPCLQNELKKLLTSKRCLLVLDDVWSDEHATSEVTMKQARVALISFSGFVKDGSRIVVTTRAKICSKALDADASIVLNGIKPSEITLLLNDTAKLNTTGTVGDPRIQELLDNRLSKLNGSPLAAIDIGGKLKDQSTSYMQCCNILDDIQHQISSVFSGHLFTYHHLPPHLQRCFALCSIFPDNWRFQPELLAKMWNAHGFVEEDLRCAGEKSHMESVARGYFDSLVDRSLFQLEEASTVEGGKQTYYVIHEHIHWMLRRATAKYCISISRSSTSRSIPATVRHLSVKSGCLGRLKEYFIKLSNVRTLLVLRDDGAPLISAIDKDILEQFTGVRVLDLTETRITRLPENIGKLKHVRYLRLPSTISSHPGDQVTRLLQTLSINERQSEEIEANISEQSSIGETAATFTMVGWFLPPNITRLIEVARCCTSSKYKLSTEMKEKLLRLAQDLEDIMGFLDPVSMEFVDEPAWLDSLWRLKDAIHCVEEILDLFELQIIDVEAANNKKTKYHGGAIWNSMNSSLIGINKDSLLQLKEVLKNLVELRERARELNQDFTSRNGRISPMYSRYSGTGPNPVRERKLFFGYHEEYGQLVSMLQDGNKDSKEVHNSVIAIIGHGGMGKTELTRQAFRDVQDKFDLLIWVHAYDKRTELDLLAEIWKSTVGTKSAVEMNISTLQEELVKLWKSKKCLLVLDDVWNNEFEHQREQAWWCSLNSYFISSTDNGSKIVMTSRAEICSRTLRADATIVLNGIKPTEIKRLVNQTAQLSTDGTISDQRIQELLHQQVHKFKQSPLAAVEVGKELKKQTSIETQCTILHNISYHIVSVFDSHLLTYNSLPPHLQRCLAFCSIFPYNWRFEPEKLTKMWMALGFVEESIYGSNGWFGRDDRTEDNASAYFKALVDRSLFQLQEACGICTEGHKQTYYAIHEQIHWMLRLASAKNCISISRDSTSHSAGACTSKTNIPATVRHLSVTSGCLDQLKEYSIRLSNLRTLLVLKEDDDGSNDPASLITAIDKGILERFKGVRVLDLTGTGITQLPENIGKLKHVRYLGLPDTISSNLCDQVTKLLFLQTLTVGDKKKKSECITNISGIGRLVKLRESIEFQVMRGSEKEGHSISELAGMNSLGETLTIKGLDAIASKEEAEEAQLGRKFSVKILKLEWGAPNPRQFDDVPSPGSSSAAAADPAVAVLEGLQPHRYLRELRITRYPGASFMKTRCLGETSPTSTWLSGLEKLTRLYLKNCRKLKVLPVLGGLPCLEHLDIKELTVVERIDGGFCGMDGLFPKLKKIVLDDMPKLEAWDDMPKVAFPLLREVSINDCPQLSSLPGLRSCRGPLHLRIKGCPAITKDTLPANFDAGNGNSTFKFY